MTTLWGLCVAVVAGIFVYLTFWAPAMKAISDLSDLLAI